MAAVICCRCARRMSLRLAGIARHPSCWATGDRSQWLYVQPKAQQRLGDEGAGLQFVAQSWVVLWPVAGLHNLALGVDLLPQGFGAV
jgi:hypothetical protein